MKKIAAIAALSASALGLSAGASFADYTLTILHINDWHSRIESNNKFESTCSAEDEGKGECIGGAARLVTAIAAERKKLDGQNVVLLNGGDNFQGSLFYTTYKGKAEAEFLNQMKFDAMTVGNHEFDDGEDALVPFLDEIKFPVLSANVKASAASKVGDRIKPSLVLEVGGQKIGIVGAVTTDTPEIASPGPNITIEDDIATITAEVEKLKGQGVNKIIALTHVGYPRDKEMIAKIPGVDVVVGGHSHSLLSNTDDKAEGPYPTMIDNPDGYKVPVTQAASYSKYLGEFTVTFDDNGVVKEAKGDPIFLDKSIKPDAAVLARIKELGAPIEELKTKEVSETTAPIDGDRKSCRARECEMGNLVVRRDPRPGQGSGRDHRLPERRRPARLDRSGRRDDGRSADRAALPEHARHLPTDRQGHRRFAGARRQHDRGRKGRVPAGRRPEIFLRQIGRAERRPRQVGRGHGERRVGADRRGQALHRRHQQFYARRRRRLRSVQGQRQERLRLRSGPGAGGRRLSDRQPAVYAEARRPHHRSCFACAAAPAEPAPAAAEAAPAEPAVPAPPPGSADIASTPPTVEAAAAAASTPEAAPAAPAEGTHTIVAGDTLWAIAKKAYGAGSKWKAIADANPDVNANDLTIGSTLKIPPAS